MPEGPRSTSPSISTDGPERLIGVGSVELLDTVVELLHEASRAAADAGRTTLAASHQWAALEVHCLY